MEIVCSTDDNYVMPTGIMLISLFENNIGERINIHVLEGGLSDSHKKQLEAIVYKYLQKIVFYHIDNELFQTFPIKNKNQASHIQSLATYFRLYMAQVLPVNIQKVLYLDGDIIVKENISDLWNFDLQGEPIAAVPDPFNNIPFHFNRLRYPQELGYFNAGVLLINLDYWRKKNVLNEFLTYIKGHAKDLFSHDQDVLNYVFRQNKIELPFKFNMMNAYFFKLKYNPVSWIYESQISTAQLSPSIIHYTFIPKPWYRACKHPYKFEFVKYKKLSPWKDVAEQRISFKEYIKQIVKELAFKFGLISIEKFPDKLYINNKE